MKADRKTTKRRDTRKKETWKLFPTPQAEVSESREYISYFNQGGYTTMKKFAVVLAVVALAAFAVPALAANPFMDVPMNHWAYDAIGQLAAKGVLSGYPDGTYKGNQPTTRYEMASALARALAVVDMTKASKQDVEMLKKLVVEFKDELDALGVKVDKIDKRVAQLESDIGGWKLTGEFRFDTKFTGNDSDNSAIYGIKNKSNQDVARYRLHVWKRISDGVTFYGRLDGEAAEWLRYYVDIKLPWDINMRVGKQAIDLEDDLYFVSNPGTWQTDAVLSDYDGLKAYWFSKPFSMGQFDLVVAKADKTDDDDGLGHSWDEHWLYMAKLGFNFNEQFSLKLGYQFIKFEYESEVIPGTFVDNDIKTWWVEPRINFTPNIALKGAYYAQDNSTNLDPKLWKVIVDIKQDALKFTSLWLEYDQVDKGFVTPNSDTFGMVANLSKYPLFYGNYGFGGYKMIVDDATVWRIAGNQKWTDTWGTWFQYAKFDLDAANADVNNYTFGVDYRYTPQVTFSLAYDKFDSDDAAYNDDVIHFRTKVNF